MGPNRGLFPTLPPGLFHCPVSQAPPLFPTFLPSVTVRACRGSFPCVLLCAIAAAQALLVSEERGLPQDHAGGRKRSWDLNPGLPESGGLHVKSFEQSPPSFPTKPYLTPALLGLLSLSWSPFLPTSWGLWLCRERLGPWESPNREF